VIDYARHGKTLSIVAEELPMPWSKKAHGSGKPKSRRS
jgi:hypothetical protein